MKKNRRNGDFFEVHYFEESLCFVEDDCCDCDVSFFDFEDGHLQAIIFLLVK